MNEIDKIISDYQKRIDEITEKAKREFRAEMEKVDKLAIRLMLVIILTYSIVLVGIV